MKFSQNSVFKIIKNFIILILVLFIIDFSAGIFFKSFLTQQKDGRYYKIHYSLEESKEEIVIIGSSRAESNYNPAVFEKVLGLSCWNAGRGGQGLPYICAIEESILNRYRPKVLIINLEQNILEHPLDYEKAAILRPFANSNESVYKILSKDNWKERLKLKSNIYCFNSSMFYFLRPFIIKNKDGNIIDKGWKPKIGNTIKGIDYKTVINKYESKPLDNDAISILNKIVDIANQKNVKLIFVISPDFFINSSESNTVRYLKKLNINKNYEIVDLSTDTNIVGKKEYFYDIQHLNNFGAVRYSNIVSEFINQLL